jgi:hypothetical protein
MRGAQRDPRAFADQPKRDRTVIGADRDPAIAAAYSVRVSSAPAEFPRAVIVVNIDDGLATA